MKASPEQDELYFLVGEAQTKRTAAQDAVSLDLQVASLLRLANIAMTSCLDAMAQLQ